MDFVTVKQLLCKVDKKQPQKKLLTKTVKKVKPKKVIKAVKKKVLTKAVTVDKALLKKKQEVAKAEALAKKLEEEAALEKIAELEKQKELAKELEKIAELEKQKQLAAEQERAKQIASAQLSKERNLFLTSVKKKINENKHYPRMAKRRNIEGSTHINFTIFKNGSIKIHTLKGDRLFFKKSKQALIESFPIEIPSKIRSTFPLQLNIDLKYALS